MNGFGSAQNAKRLQVFILERLSSQLHAAEQQLCPPAPPAPPPRQHSANIFCFDWEPPGRVSYVKMTCYKCKLPDMTREMFLQFIHHPVRSHRDPSHHSVVCITSIASYCFAAVRTLNATQPKVELIFFSILCICDTSKDSCLLS